MDNGWICIHRKLLKNPMVEKPMYFSLWIILLLKANHEARKFIWNGKTIDVPAGSFVTGRKKLSTETGIPETTMERILNYFESEKQIGQQKTTKYRLISILRWKDYQIVDNRRTTEKAAFDKNKEKSGHQKYENNLYETTMVTGNKKILDSKWTTDGQQTDTNNNDNNVTIKHMSEVSDAFNRFWSEYPKKELKKKTQEIWKRKKLDSKINEILSFISEAKDKDRWKKGFVKQPPVFLNGECWNDDLSSYDDKFKPQEKKSNSSMSSLAMLADL